MRALFVLAFAACTLFAPAAAQRLVTESYDITIDSRCKEGVVSCSNVKFAGIERKTGKTLRLKGEDLHTRCADGVTPCRFLGHVFLHGKRRYTVRENGALTISQGKKILLEEQGSWVEMP